MARTVTIHNGKKYYHDEITEANKSKLPAKVIEAYEEIIKPKTLK